MCSFTLFKHRGQHWGLSGNKYDATLTFGALAVDGGAGAPIAAGVRCCLARGGSCLVALRGDELCHGSWEKLLEQSRGPRRRTESVSGGRASAVCMPPWH